MLIGVYHGLTRGRARLDSLTGILQMYLLFQLEVTVKPDTKPFPRDVEDQS